MYNDFKILSKNNTDELIFYKMMEKKNERKNTIHLPSEKEKKIKRKILHNQLTVLFFST